MTEQTRDVLVVDDDSDLREALAELLKLDRLNVVTTATADEAVALLEGDFRPCVIVLDLLLPQGMSGREFRDRLLAHVEWKHIPLVVLSGVNVRPEVTAAELNLPADHVILKPGNMDALCALVAHYCEAVAA